MGRRKKEPRSAHREHIAAAAQELFLQKGVAAASMDEIAQTAGYSKATLYVYFENKEEIVSLLVLESMRKLQDCLGRALEGQLSTEGKYDLICRALLQYQEEFPLYFEMALDEIKIDFLTREHLPEEEETFRVGEEINAQLRQFLEEGIKTGALRADIKILPTIFSFWGMLAGLIRTADRKEAYLIQELKLTKQQFLAYGFDMLYRSIEKANAKGEKR